MTSLPLFFIHGWATNSHIWQNRYNYSRTYYYDAPEFPDFDHIVKSFENYYYRMGQQRTILIGWSLGGMLALQLAHRFPEQIAKVILISSTACFTTRESYAAGLSPAIVKRLAKKLKQDHRQVQLDFYNLMFSAREQEAVSAFFAGLSPLMFDISLASLTAGLDYLLTTDLRPVIPHISVPCHIIHGSADEICPLAAGHYLAEHLPQATLHVLRHAGHIPFFTRDTDFQTTLEECLCNDQ
jgi:pimeloyl-[acyl-carrier protein] methyl ester esterase